eukprot:gnl/TRDRNA2_/TRDRNA2_202970_c0_seq1.p1 gnl/TRDRNA2_/TRDRNA2_202970_c0~~gnl/TRDRNA2_/TRDRNA2_202970_c0_seq1.p1  ORF type:complete len:439 (+),score=56.07 gnl/TRDRNA2_/TRDRNA2_202970_c0_seq1:90-1406(+)
MSHVTEDEAFARALAQVPEGDDEALARALAEAEDLAVVPSSMAVDLEPTEGWSPVVVKPLATQQTNKDALPNLEEVRLELRKQNYALELLSEPEVCREQLRHALMAGHSCEVPAPNNDFPAWEWTETVLSAGPRRASHGLDALRAVGRARLARRAEAPHSYVVEIAFRGSCKVDNWITNFDGKLMPMEVGGPEERSGANVHRGFQEAYLSLRGGVFGMLDDSLLRLWGSHDQESSILALVTGHSLGGALATLAAFDLATTRGYEVRCVVWGAPRVGDAAFVARYNAAVAKHARFVNKFDIVPRVPMSPSDENDDGTVLPKYVRTVLYTLVWRPHEMLGVVGSQYRHICPSVMLDPDADGATFLRACGSKILRGKTVAAVKALCHVHIGPQYEHNLESVLGESSPAAHTRSSVQDSSSASAVAAPVASGSTGGIRLGPR